MTGPSLLRDALKHSPLTQRAFAKKIKLHDSLLSKMKRGQYVPPLEVLVRIKKATGIPLEAWARNGRLA